ncbi:MAG: Hpt domain-containing protein [Syntrophomonadaceae bacterium]|nr:Hpt domain-containing protein [Syntrophomonadaceae bacterium]
MKFTFEPDDLEILQGIVEESSEHLNGIEEGILKMEAEFDSKELDSVFRAMHSVKGVASFVDFIPIKDTAHSLESFLTDMKKGTYVANSEITDLLLRGVDILNLLVGQLGVCLKELEANPPREAFELEINDFSFGEFVEEAEGVRERVVYELENGSENASVEVVPESPQPAATMIKVEISSFLSQALDDFIEECNEHLDTIEKNCVEIERNPNNSELLNAILRGFHSIKGGAGVIISMQDHDKPGDPFMNIKNLTHAVETLLQVHRNQETPLSAQEVDLILATVDRTAALSKLVMEENEEVPEIDDLLKRIEALSQGDKEKAAAAGTNAVVDNLPKQLAAFVNITNQGLESMESIINSAQVDMPVNHRRIKQYARALNSISSSCRYLDFDDVVDLVATHLQYVDSLRPDRDLVASEVIESLRNGHLAIKQLLAGKIDQIKLTLNQVPVEYAEKKVGEILVEQNKISQCDLDRALAQQKRIGEILVDSGAAKPRDIEMALMEQEAAKEKVKSAPAEAARASTDISGQSIRVSQEKMNRLMNMIGELLISKNRIFHLSSKIGTEYEIPPLAREVKDVASEVSRIADELQDAIMSARMLPLRVLFQRYPRTIRDISRKAGKDVDLIIEGEETELDKTVVEAINDPLVHMLRNAVDHGIESPETRKALGKNPKGSIYLKARYQGNHVLIEIVDDGKGLNPEEIKAKALKKGLIRPEQIETMSNEDAYHLVFLPGFSTKDEVSELSGRGVGMDVVKSNITQVGGSVNMSSKINEGTTFTLKIPLSMSIIRGLMVKTAEQTYIIPLDAIEETVKLPATQIRRYKNLLLADVREEILHLIRLQDILNPDNEIDLDYTTQDQRVSIVVMEVDGYRFGLIVDSFQHEQEFVVKALVEELASLKIYTGATIMGDGSVVLILNSPQLYQAFLMMNVGG